MAERYATILKTDSGEEIVSSIAQMEGVPPEIRSSMKDTARVIKAPDGLKIGMVKGGKHQAVGGFGFPDNSPNRAESEPSTSTVDKVRADVAKK